MAVKSEVRGERQEVRVWNGMKKGVFARSAATWQSRVVSTFLMTLIFMIPVVAQAEIPIISRDSIIRYAATGVGSPYQWGGSKWNPNDRSWGGADCSGFVQKAWQIPRRQAYTESAGSPRFTTREFYYNNTHWYSISRSNLAKGDMLVYRNDSGGHSVIYHYGDKWGSAVIYEAASTKTGIVHRERYFPSYFKARRRHRLTDSDPALMANVRLENGSYINGQPNARASSTLYFDYFQLNDLLAIRNTDIRNDTKVNAYSINRNVIQNRQYGLDSYQIIQQGQVWAQSGYMKLVSGGQKIYAARKTNEGSLYLARNENEKSVANVLDYFEPRRDILYITNPNAVIVKVAIYLINDGKICSRLEMRIRPRGVAKISYKNSPRKHFNTAFVRVNSAGERVFVTKRTAGTNFVSAEPVSTLSRINYLPNFKPGEDLLYIANPASTKVKMVIDYIQNSRSYLKVTKYIGPRDVIAVDYRSKLKNLRQVYVRIKSGSPILASKRMADSRFQASLTSKEAAQISYVVNFKPATQRLYIINPLNSRQNATVQVIAGGKEVYKKTYSVSRNTQRYINLAGTGAAKYSDTYVRIIASF